MDGQLFDSHCHIHEAELALLDQDSMWQKAQDADPQAMLQRAAAQGVAGALCVGTTLADSQRAVAFAHANPQCWAAVGVHPHEAKDIDQALSGLAELATQPRVVAIGEIGLDYFYEHSAKDQQIAALHAQLDLAEKYNLPVSFHVRDAFDDFWPVFDAHKNIRGVLHSFTDNWQNCQKALDRGLFIGINGIITFTKNDWQLDIAKQLPLQKILLETDAPFLTPKPIRGTVNEPAYVSLVAAFLAELRGDSTKNIANHTTHNARELFALN